jgi:CRISPR/Cas system-associated exonuclease Cas4 (RecB family)
MSVYKRKSWNLFNPKSEEPHRLSRSKIDLFVQCQRCFYFDQRLGVSRPQSFPLTLNNAVDFLMKKEFDIHRAEKSQHPIMKKYGIDAVPLEHERLEEWRDALKRGISCHHKKTNLILRGGVDDVWVKPDGELIIVDYKATSKDEEITLDDEWKQQYKRQMEIYQWLFRENGFKVSETGYFVYVNGKTDRKAFDGKLEFDVTVIPHKGKTDWIEDVVCKLHDCLMGEDIPPATVDCEYCGYIQAHRDILLERAAQKGKKVKMKI